MRKLFLILLLLCLGLSGCDWQDSPEEFPTSPPLPTLKQADPEPLPDYTTWPYDLSGAAAPLLADDGTDEPSVVGPAGTVKAKTYLGSGPIDSIYADVDGDGQTELIYRCAGPTSGLLTVGICVYGLELGWPVLKASTVFCLQSYSSDFYLQSDGREAAVCLDDGSGGTLRLPLGIRDGCVVLNYDTLPEGISSMGDSWFKGYGCSFAELKNRVGDTAILDHWACLMWKESFMMVLDSDPEGLQLQTICAAVTDNGVTVTGFLRFQKVEKDETLIWTSEGITPAAPVTDLAALEGLTWEQLTDRLGPCHFDLGSGTDFPCWFTEDAKLLTLRMNGVSENAALYDLTSDEPLFAAAGRKQVIVDQSSVPTRVCGAEAWETFLRNTAEGNADEILILRDFGDGPYETFLSFDGSVYTVAENGVNYCFRHLITDWEEDPPDSATFDRAVHYLLSDDPEMTFQRWMGYLLSSAPDPDFPAVLGLFSVFE